MPVIDVLPDSNLVNFSSWLYWQNSDQTPYVREGVSSFLAESLLLPRVEQVVIDPELGFVDMNDGRVYRDIFDRTIEYYCTNKKLKDRFESEKRGFENAKTLIESVYANTGIYPPIVIASPPGEIYDAGEHTKSITFVGIPEQTKDQNPVYSLYTIPTSELGLDEHWEIVRVISDVQESMTVLDYSLENITSESVVAFPVLLKDMSDSLEHLAENLGYEGWREVEYLGNISSRFARERHTTDERRSYLVSWFTDRIEKYVREGRDRRNFDELDEVMRQVFAAERGGYFLENEFSKLYDVSYFLESLVSVELADMFYVSDSIKHDVRTTEEYSPLAGLYWWIMSNGEAKDSYMGTGCGAGGVGFERDILQASGGFNQGLNMTTFSGLMGIGESDNLASYNTGKYTDYYDYKPGECKNCKQQKRYVAHPKSREIQCAGWCSDCEE